MSNQTPIGRARRLRKEMTPEEKKIWLYLRNRKFHGYKILRQHPIVYQLSHNKPDFFIADFYCASQKLVIEVDGKIHDFHKEDDLHRDAILKYLGLRILRIKNEECENMNLVLNKIKAALEQPSAQIPNI